MSFACVNCYAQISSNCPHFAVTETKGITITPNQCQYGIKKELRAINISCVCGVQKVEFFRAGGYYTLYRCSCNHLLLFSGLNKKISLAEINEQSQERYPCSICPYCKGSKERCINSFTRCSNCDGTGGIKGSELCGLCEGGGAVVSGRRVINCTRCVRV